MKENQRNNKWKRSQRKFKNIMNMKRTREKWRQGKAKGKGVGREGVGGKKN
jgi:hypothetical protein